jgi:hypothetical protein
VHYAAMGERLEHMNRSTSITNKLRIINEKIISLLPVHGKHFEAVYEAFNRLCGEMRQTLLMKDKVGGGGGGGGGAADKRLSLAATFQRFVNFHRKLLPYQILRLEEESRQTSSTPSLHMRNNSLVATHRRLLAATEKLNSYVRLGFLSGNERGTRPSRKNAPLVASKGLKALFAVYETLSVFSQQTASAITQEHKAPFILPAFRAVNERMVSSLTSVVTSTHRLTEALNDYQTLVSTPSKYAVCGAFLETQFFNMDLPGLEKRGRKYFEKLIAIAGPPGSAPTSSALPSSSSSSSLQHQHHHHQQHQHQHQPAAVADDRHAHDAQHASLAAVQREAAEQLAQLKARHEKELTDLRTKAEREKELALSVVRSRLEHERDDRVAEVERERAEQVRAADDRIVALLAENESLRAQLQRQNELVVQDRKEAFLQLTPQLSSGGAEAAALEAEVARLKVELAELRAVQGVGALADAATSSSTAEQLDAIRAGYEDQIATLADHITDLETRLQDSDAALAAIKKNKVLCHNCPKWNSVAYLISPEAEGGKVCKNGNHTTGFNWK